MAIAITGISAMDFYRRHYPPNRSPRLSSYHFEEPCSCSDETVWCLAPSWVTPEFLALEHGKLHVLARSASKRGGSRSITAHVWSGALPPGSFFAYSEEVAIASPGFIFLQLASSLNLIELICLGYELCGLYSFDESFERGLRLRETPLATTSDLAYFLAAAKGMHGYRRASTALSHIAKRSASPMETADAMLACLPYRYGGYGLRYPQFNYPIELSANARRISGKRELIADLCWPDAMLAVEHNGHFDHSSPRSLSADRARVNALLEMGFEVVELTSGQVASLAAFEAIILRVATKLGKHIPLEKRGALPQRIDLRKELFAWNRAGGRKPSPNQAKR